MTKSIISSLNFKVKNSQEVSNWYSKVLGMSTTKVGDTFICQYPGQQTKLSFENFAGSDVGSNQKTSVYWKIGIGLEDVKLGQQNILAAGTSVTSPRQFQEIGYLCHLNDPAANSLELLQNTFEKNFVKPEPQNEFALGQPGKIGQITIRSSDIEKTLLLYQTVLGMKLLSIQPVTQYGFTLYFLAYTDDVPPNTNNLEAVENREWLWQRPYTTLEIQYKPSFELAALDGGEGVAGMTLELASDPREQLNKYKMDHEKVDDKSVRIVDNDGFVVLAKF